MTSQNYDQLYKQFAEGKVGTKIQNDWAYPHHTCLTHHMRQLNLQAQLFSLSAIWMICWIIADYSGSFNTGSQFCFKVSEKNVLLSLQAKDFTKVWLWMPNYKLKIVIKCSIFSKVDLFYKIWDAWTFYCKQTSKVLTHISIIAK